MATKDAPGMCEECDCEDPTALAGLPSDCDCTCHGVRLGAGPGDGEGAGAFAKAEGASLIDRMMAFEEGELAPEGVKELFQELVDSGLAWSAAGFYGRTAVDMLRAHELEATTPAARRVMGFWKLPQ